MWTRAGVARCPPTQGRRQKSFLNTLFAKETLHVILNVHTYIYIYIPEVLGGKEPYVPWSKDPLLVIHLLVRILNDRNMFLLLREP